MAKAKERHEEKLVQVKERAAAANVQAKEIALRVNVSRKTPEGKRFCLVCNVAFHGDVSRHNNGKAHQQRLLAKTESNHDLAGGKEMWKKIASSPSLSTLNSIANAGANSTVGASTSSTNIVEDVNKSLYPVERDKAIKRRAKKIRMVGVFFLLIFLILFCVSCTKSTSYLASPCSCRTIFWRRRFQYR